jgi:hypothetical protein
MKANSHRLTREVVAKNSSLHRRRRLGVEMNRSFFVIVWAALKVLAKAT